MNYLLSQIFLCLLAAFILGAIIGWLWRHITCKGCREELLRLQKEIADLRSKPAPVTVKAKKTKKIEATKVEKPKTKIVEAAKIVETIVKDEEEPIFLSAPRGEKSDNLKRIKGVGKVLEAKLNSKGVYHFDQIAKWNQDNIDSINESLSFPGRIEREDWIAQAKLLAKGLETEFSNKVDKGDVYNK